MTRIYNVTSMEVLPKLNAYDDVVVKLNFTYGNSEALLSGVCDLNPPEPGSSFSPLESISKETALSWLLSQCPNSTEQFDERLDREIAERNNQPFIYD